MARQLKAGQLGDWPADRPAIRVVLGVAALAGGMAVAWQAAGSTAVLAGMAVVLAAGNGYGKAYSP
ncbi:MAG TPA: hypothetical protein VMA32_05630 [Streptosporangiaceae bacterium]|nr:hypothetical protein [Streptosporangiaceae bacterium]